MASDPHQEFLSSLVDAIKNYTGDDPLRPWLTGIQRMLESLPPHLWKEKLPRFLQKCAESFQSDRRYRDDPRYLRVWIQLMDYVDDAKVLLRKLEKQKIGLRQAAFYIAYALYYEKRKKYEHAEKMYHLGVQNLAEPASELQEAYEQFLHRMEMRKKRKAKSSKFVEERFNGSKDYVKLPSTYLGNIPSCGDEVVCHPQSVTDVTRSSGAKKNSEHRGSTKSTSVCSNDTIVVKFVDSAIVGKSQVEDACHHGLVDPTINTKEAMSAINNMFQEPLVTEPKVKRRSNQRKPKENQQNKGFEVFMDETSEGGENLHVQKPKENQHNIGFEVFMDGTSEGGENLHVQKPKVSDQNESPKFKNPELSKKEKETELQKPFVRAFEIYAADDEDDCACEDGVEKVMEGPKQTHSKSVSNFSKHNNRYHSSFKNPGILREDTVIRRFIGSTIFSEPKVENACHHGLVDPTINLKEAIDDINSMFGKPLDFIKANKPKKEVRLLNQKPGHQSFSILPDDEAEVPEGKLLDQKSVCHGFSILTDDEVVGNSSGESSDLQPASHGFSILADDVEQDSKGRASSSISRNSSVEDGLSEPTLFTKEALADINEMFGRPLDF